ncbi:MAG: hypothetical protein SOV68_05270, partial [Ligilactobacillus salivarius]|nr:hypothetical protein [Ligilactobacillus salivarius]
NRRWSKDQSSLHKNKNNKKKTVKQLKLRVGLIVFWYLKVSFFPDTYDFSPLSYIIVMQINITRNLPFSIICRDCRIIHNIFI